MAGFIFGQGTPDTYESLQAKRKAAERLAVTASRAPQNVGEGLTALGQAIAYRRLSGQADRGEAEGRAAADGQYNAILGRTALGGLYGNRLAGAPPAGAPPAMAGAGVPPVTANPAGLPQSIIGAVDRVNPPAPTTPPPEAYSLAAKNLGMNERDQGAALAEYMANGGVNLDPATRAWCADYVNATLAQTGVQGTGSSMARSFLEWGQPVDQPQRGDVAVFSRGDPNGPYGHVGFFDSYNPDGSIKVLGGNQGDAVSLADYSAADLLGFRRPGEAAPAPGGMGDIAQIGTLLSNPYLGEGQKMVLAQLLQTQMEAMQPPDPMQALDMEYKQAQIDQMRGGGNLPDGYEAKHMTAVAGGLVPGTPEYQQFMLGSTEGEEFGLTPIWGRDKDGNPALAQLSKNGVVKQSELPEGWQPDPALNAQMQAEGRAIGAARGEAIAAAPTQIANADAALQGISELRNHPARAWGTGGTSVFNAIPGTGGMDFNSRVEQLKGGAFLTAIQQLQGMGALSNAEGATATAAVTRLSTALSEDAFLDALDDYEAIVKAGRERAEKRLPGQPTSEAPAGQTFTFNPATGELE
jgi:uncharacterized protein (TIGR02594 family)